MKRNYLLGIIVISLLVIPLYSTYAMFTESIETDEIINLSTAVINLDSEIVEYEQITIKGNESKSIMVNISNNTDSNLYYGVWYEMLKPTSINDNIEIAKLTSSTDSTQGTINVGLEKNVKIVIKNTGSSSITINIGVSYSKTSSLGLPTNRYIITNELQGKYIINTSVKNGSTITPTKIVDVGNSTSISVKPSAGYKYKNVSCTNAEASYNTGNNTLTLTNITDDVSCTVTNEVSTYTVTAKAGTGGTVSGSSSKTVNYNGSTTFTVIPNAGYQYSSVSCPSGITGSYNTGNNTLTVSGVKASGTCTVNFSLKTYTVTVTATNGTSNPTSRTVNHGGSTTFTVTPNSGYEYSFLSCTGGSYNEGNNTLTVSNVTSNLNCTVEFDLPGVNAIIYFDTKYSGAYKTTFKNNNITYTRAPSLNMMTDVGDNVRFYGTSANNYVKFNNELWRIIGIFKNVNDGTGTRETRLKIMRNDSIGEYAFNSTNDNIWGNASLNTYLNTTFYNSFSDKAKSMVKDSLWNLGGWTTLSIYADMFYKYERGTTVYPGNSTSWTGKISLMYPSDYLYSSDLTSCSKTATTWDSNGCYNTSWIYTNKNEWLLSPNANTLDSTFFIQNLGRIGYNYTTYSYAVRPALYLSPEVTITGGTGTSTDPYTLSI